MTTVLEGLSDGFYTAFFEPDPEKRKEAIESWVKQSTPVIQSAVENDLRAYLDGILEATWTPKGWASRVQKFCGMYQGLGRKSQPVPFIDAYQVHLDVKLLAPSSKDIAIGTLAPEVRAKTNAAADTAKWAIAKMEPPSPIALREIDLHGKTVEEATPIVESFLHESYRDNVRQVRIIHGKGIFVLQTAIREYLGKHNLVDAKSIRAAEKDYGGEGATEANLVEFAVDQ